MSGDSLEGLTRVELDHAESRDFALGKGPLRPRDAATLVLLDRKDGELFVLMGRRHSRHAFMPGKFVFPGGRTDPGDGRVPVAAGLHKAEEAKIASASSRMTTTRARAIAMSAVRETYEEAGLLIGKRGSFSTSYPAWGKFAENDVAPALDGLRFLARAITPPGRVRRFDTRFLAAWRSEVALALPEGPPTDELEELVWIPLAQAKQLDLPRITGNVLNDIEWRISVDSELRPGGPVPFYQMRNNRFLRYII
ncbi:MAG: NUDIX domain-containing protein [Rhizobiaceae bacterium]|nr:NUDIX domain-containing protein [Rhizobiaceae bacterium]